MAGTTYTKPELQIMEVLWNQGACSIREIHEAVSKKERPAYTTVQTMVYRLEAKKAVQWPAVRKTVGEMRLPEQMASPEKAIPTYG